MGESTMLEYTINNSRKENSRKQYPLAVKFYYHVAYSKTDGKWHVIKAWDLQPSCCDTKEKAIEQARFLAEKEENAQVIIHPKSQYQSYAMSNDELYHIYKWLDF